MIRVAMLAALSALFVQDDLQNSYKGKTPPELTGDKDAWMNAKDALKLEKLKGRVVWLEFSFLN